MGSFDQKNDNPFRPQESHPGQAKDVLFGWLVGKAGADLGLAQALAASEAHTAEQFKRLEETLIARIHALQNQQPTVGHDQASSNRELSELRAETQTLAKRMAQLESTAQEPAHLREILRDEMTNLRNQLNERQNEIEARYTNVFKLVQSVSGVIQELEHQLRDKMLAVEGGDRELRQFKSDVQSLAERMGQIESATEKGRATAAAETQLTQQSIEGLKGEMAGLKSRLTETQRDAWPAESSIKGLEESFQEKFNVIRGILAKSQEELHGREKLLREEFGVELRTLQGQLSQLKATDSDDQGLEERLSERIRDIQLRMAKEREHLELREAEISESFKAELARSEARQVERPVDETVIHALQESLSARIQQLQNQVGSDLGRLDSREADIAELRAETQALHDRLNRFEPTPHEGSLPAGTEAERAEWIKGAEEIINAKIQALENRFGQELQAFEHGNGALEQCKSEISALVMRLAQLESASLEARQLENAGARGVDVEQIIGNLRAEFGKLRADLTEQQQKSAPAPSQIKGLEEAVNAKFLEIQRRLTIERENQQGRDNELRSGIEEIARRMAQAELMGHQTQELISGGTESAAKLKEEVQAELAALEARIGDRQAGESVMRGIEATLDSKLQGIQRQVGEKLILFEDSDREMKGLKAEVKNLAQQVAQITAPTHGAQLTTTGPVAATVETPIGKTDATKDQAHEPEGSVSQPLDRQAIGEKEQIKHLQDRMSAEIQRVRAELKEKSGRWKVRRGTS